MYVKYVDDQGQELKTVDWEDNDFTAPWSCMTPMKGEQMWLPDHGLYEVTLTRWIMEEENPHIYVKLNYIRRHL